MENSNLKDKFKKINMKEIIKFVIKYYRYIVAGALFVVMMVVLATCAGADDVKDGVVGDTGNVATAEYGVNAHEDVNALVAQYYTAYADGDITTLSAIATPLSANEQSYIAMFSQYVDEYQNVVCYTKSGLEDNSYLVSVTMEVKFTGVDTPAPGLDFFYVRTNEEGVLYIDNLYSQYNLANQENALDTSVQNMIYNFNCQEDFLAIESDVQARYNTAVEADVNLSTMIYTTVPNAINNWVTQVTAQNAQAQSTEVASTEVATEMPAEGTDVAVESTEAVEEEPTVEEPEAVEQETVYTTAKVNVREEANTSSSKLGTVAEGTAITRIGTEGDWSKVDYEGTTGYIKTEFLTTESAEDVDADDDTDENEEVASDSNLTEGTEIRLENTVNIRSGMSETSDRIGTAYSGEKVTVIMSYAEGWTKVKWNGKTGYIKSSLLQ